MTNCACACHTGPYTPCDIPGGCGHLHRVDRLPNLRALAGHGDIPAPAARQERPGWACAIHLPPKPGHTWRPADEGYRTCGACCNLLHRWLSPLGVDTEGRPDNLPYLYLTLDPRPGNNGPGRRSPGFASRSPGSDHVISMRDARTVQVDDTDPCSAAAILRAWVLWVWDERYDDQALNHPNYRQRRTELPATVNTAAAWLDRNLDWLTRRDTITDFHAELKELRRKLRAANGDRGQPPVGHCFEQLTDGECGAPIYMPRGEKPRAPDEPITDLPELVCPACRSSYTGVRLIRLRLAEEKQAKAAAGAGDPTR